MKKTISKVILLTLALAIMMSTLSSCVLRLGGEEDYISREELDDILGSIIAGDVTIENAPTYNIEIDGDVNRNVAAAAKAVLSAVSVYATFELGYTGANSKGTAAGAGVIYKLDKTTGDAYIITNYHVVYDSRSTTADRISRDIVLRLYGYEDTATGNYPEYDIPATFIGGSMTEDLAVLKVDGSRLLIESAATAVTFANSDEVSILDTAIAIGNPSSEGLSATLGCINVDSEYVKITTADGSSTQTQRLFRIDTAVNSGNSGGGLFNDRGELIGIVNAKASSYSVENVGYAIPGNLTKHVVDNIIDYCDGTSETHGYKYMLGITLGSKDLTAVYDSATGKVHKTETVYVASITEGTAAGDVSSVGDVIKSITIDGVTYEITRMYQVIDCMFDVRADSTLQITFVSEDGTERTEIIDVSKMTSQKIA